MVRQHFIVIADSKLNCNPSVYPYTASISTPFPRVLVAYPSSEPVSSFTGNFSQCLPLVAGSYDTTTFFTAHTQIRDLNGEAAIVHFRRSNYPITSGDYVRKRASFSDSCYFSSYPGYKNCSGEILVFGNFNGSFASTGDSYFQSFLTDAGSYIQQGALTPAVGAWNIIKVGPLSGTLSSTGHPIWTMSTINFSNTAIYRPTSATYTLNFPVTYRPSSTGPSMFPTGTWVAYANESSLPSTAYYSYTRPWTAFPNYTVSFVTGMPYTQVYTGLTNVYKGSSFTLEPLTIP